MWFKDGDGKGAYFGLDGQSKQRSFLASPLEFSRVTSGFAMRMHPILNSWKQHKGVDYGAPTGTPIRAIGDGVVEFAGWQNGYGNVVQVRHGNERLTVYAHLSRIEVAKGQKVDQGAIIGAVGQTGWATGPHLHFEVKIDASSRTDAGGESTRHRPDRPPSPRPALASVRGQLTVRRRGPRPVRGVAARAVSTVLPG